MTQLATYQTDTSDMLIPHGVFRSFFATVTGIVDGVTATDTESVAVVHSYCDNVLRFLDAHHGGEDAILWPALTERCAEARKLIGRMEGEHASVHAARERAGAALGSWYALPSRETARALTTALGDLRAVLENHLSEEEVEILPLASRHVSPEEWGSLPGHAMSHFSGDKIWLILGLVFEQMSSEQLATTLTLMPPPVVEMWTTSGKPAFDEFIAAVRRGR